MRSPELLIVPCRARFHLTGQRVQIISSRMAESHDAERIRGEILQKDFEDAIEELFQQNVPINDYDESVDLHTSDDKEVDWMQTYIAEMNLEIPDCYIPSDPELDDLTYNSLAAGYPQVPDTVRQPDMDFKGLMTGDYVRVTLIFASLLSLSTQLFFVGCGSIISQRS